MPRISQSIPLYSNSSRAISSHPIPQPLHHLHLYTHYPLTAPVPHPLHQQTHYPLTPPLSYPYPYPYTSHLPLPYPYQYPTPYPPPPPTSPSTPILHKPTPSLSSPHPPSHNPHISAPTHPSIHPSPLPHTHPSIHPSIRPLARRASTNKQTNHVSHVAASPTSLQRAQEKGKRTGRERCYKGKKAFERQGGILASD